MLQRRLTRKGFDVVIAENGQVGVDKSKSENPDLILMDLSMPVMDGWDAIKVIKGDELTTFTRQLATLLDAGLPLLRALEVMIRQEKNVRFQAVLEQIADQVKSGNSFSDGLTQHPKIFDRLFVNMVRAGEAGGVLDVVLARLAGFMEKALKTKKKVKAAMVSNCW